MTATERIVDLMICEDCMWASGGYDYGYFAHPDHEAAYEQASARLVRWERHHDPDWDQQISLTAEDCGFCGLDPLGARYGQPAVLREEAGA